MFYKLTGTKKDDVINHSITKFIHPDSQDPFYFHNYKLWKTREASHCEILLNARDNKLSVEVESSFYHHESQTYIRSALIDLALIKRNEDRLHVEVARAERSDKLKSVFLNNLSHEIRTPLNAIVGFSEFLNEEGLDREQIQHLTGVIKQSSDQLLEIIEEIVSISTIEAGLTDLIDMLGGKFWLDSGEERGSTFFFTIPYSPFARKPLSAPKQMARMETTNKTILIAEAEENNYELTRVMLSSFGMEMEFISKVNKYLA